MRQFAQQILPAGLPADDGLGLRRRRSRRARTGLLLHNAPSLTIEAQVEQAGAREVDQRSGRRRDGNYLPHLLPVDPTLHWANPPGGHGGTRHAADLRRRPPARTPARCPSSPTCTAPSASATRATATPRPGTCPAADNIPAGYATEGTWYDFFAGKAAAELRRHLGPRLRHLPVSERQPRVDDLVPRPRAGHDPAERVRRSGRLLHRPWRPRRRRGRARLPLRHARPCCPGPAPKENDKFPPNKTYYEIPIAIQDRAFNADGSLFYPDTREFFDGATAQVPGYIPDTDLSPIWNPEFFGNMIMVNGNTWPFQTVEQRRYRFRFLNGCQSRFLILDFANIPGVEVWQIGNEGGFLAAPVNLTGHGQPAADGPGRARRRDRRLHQRAGRATTCSATSVPTSRSAAACPIDDFDAGRSRHHRADHAVQGGAGAWLPTRRHRRSSSCCRPLTPLPAPVTTRPLALIEMMSMVPADGPAAAMLGTVEATERACAMHHDVDGAGDREPRMSATPRSGSSTTSPPTPTRCTSTRWSSRWSTGRRSSSTKRMATAAAVRLGCGTARRPSRGRAGFKDTVIAYPGEVTRIRAQFNTPGQFVWHCHIVEHEDNEMMRPYRIGPEQPGQPMPQYAHDALTSPDSREARRRTAPAAARRRGRPVRAAGSENAWAGRRRRPTTEGESAGRRFRCRCGAPARARRRRSPGTGCGAPGPRRRP